MGGTRLVVESILLEDIRLEVECILLGVIRQEVGCTLLEGTRVGLGGTRLVVEFILLEDIRPELQGILREVLRLAFRCILLGDTLLGVGSFLLDPGLARDLEVLLRKRECPFIHLVAEMLVGLLGQAGSTLPVRASSLLEAVLRGPAVVSILQGLVHQVLMDLAQVDQALMAQVPTVQARTVLARMAQALRDQVQMVQDPKVQARMGQVRTVPVQTGRGHMVQVQMAQAQVDPGRMVLVPMDLAQMDLVRVGSLGVKAAAKLRWSSPPRNMSAQLRLHLHHAPLHQQPSWQEA